MSTPSSQNAMSIPIEDLREHPILKTQPLWADDDPRWDHLAESIRAHGVFTPLHISADHQVVDGRHRLRAAKRASLDTVPCLVVPDDQVISTMVESLCLRKHLSKGALAYCAFPLLRPAMEEARQRRLTDLKRGTQSRLFTSASSRGEMSIEMLAARVGISTELLRQAQKVHGIFEEDPEYRDEMEPRILDLQDPVGLGAVIAGYAGRRSTAGQAKHRREHEQMSLFAEAWSTLGKRWVYWGKLGDEERDEVRPVIRRTVAAMPPDLRHELKRAIAAAEKEAA